MNETDHHTQKEIEKLERWLAGYSTPAPSPEAVRRARTAVRRELSVQHAGGTAGRWKVWHGSIAAAAALLLAVGIGWYSQSMDGASVVASADRELYWVLSERSEENAMVLASLDEALSEVETWMTNIDWGADGALMYELMEEAFSDSNDEPQSLGRSSLQPKQYTQVMQERVEKRSV